MNETDHVEYENKLIAFCMDVGKMNQPQKFGELMSLTAKHFPQDSNLGELEKDRERLDAQFKNAWEVGYNDRIGYWTVLERGQVVGCLAKGPTLRHALDNAILTMAKPKQNL